MGEKSIIKTAKFEVTSTIVEELGRNLYSSDNSIIVELVANSYDADASEVKIDFNPEGDSITISDDGVGMSQKTIEEHFLTVGSKKAKEFKSSKGRISLGRKGIGKLSFFALGENIEVNTVCDGIMNSFNLKYSELHKEIQRVDITQLPTTKENGTVIKISGLLDGVKKHVFFKKMIIGLSQVFNELLNDDFSIDISANNSELEGKTLEGSYRLKKAHPNFNQTLVFYSLDAETDKVLEIAKAASSKHLNKLMMSSNLPQNILADFKKSDETWKLINDHKSFKGVQKQTVISGITKKHDIKGYVASIITSKAVTDNEPESSSENDRAFLDGNFIIVKSSNRRISISSNGRSGMINAKGSLGLSAKFYTKYLFGQIKSDMLEDKEFYGEDITIPNREGYRKNNPRWNYISVILKILGDKAMNFANDIAAKKKKIIKDVKTDSNKILIRKYKEKFREAESDRERGSFFDDFVVEISKQKFENESVNKSFILISFTKNGDGSETKSLVLAKILKKITDKYSKHTRILYTGSIELGTGIKSGERLYNVIKESLWKNPKMYSRFHCFTFINKEYMDNWFTDIEYGMAFGNSEMSKHLIPIDITSFRVGEVEIDEMVRHNPLEYDNITIFTKEKLKEILPGILDKLLVKVTDEQINAIIDDEFK